jgi:hypothetical protein
MVPAGVELIALCDQDDRWHPDKLAVLRERLGDARLVYSDQRMVTHDGIVLRDSLWEGRRHDQRNLASLLVANAVPGAAALLRRDLLDLALPFPQAPGAQFHDHWLALVALCSGELRYVDRPLLDWVQHAAAASMGAGDGRPAPGSRGWRAAYFGGYLPRVIQAQTLLLRCDRELTPSKRRTLERFVRADRSAAAFVWLALRPLRRLAGRDETLGGEWALACGLAWRRLIRVATFGGRLRGGSGNEASNGRPPRFEQRRLARWRSGA